MRQSSKTAQRKCKLDCRQRSVRREKIYSNFTSSQKNTQLKPNVQYEYSSGRNTLIHLFERLFIRCCTPFLKLKSYVPVSKDEEITRLSHSFTAVSSSNSLFIIRLHINGVDNLIQTFMNTLDECLSTEEVALLHNAISYESHPPTQKPNLGRTYKFFTDTKLLSDCLFASLTACLTLNRMLLSPRWTVILPRTLPKVRGRNMPLDQALLLSFSGDFSSLTIRAA